MQHGVNSGESGLDLRHPLGYIGREMGNSLDGFAAQAAKFVFVAQVLEGDAANQSAGAGDQDFSSFHGTSYSRPPCARQAWIAPAAAYCFVMGFQVNKLGALLA